MRTLILAAVLAAAPTAAEAAVTIEFTSSAGTGRIVIDTAHLGAATTQADGSFNYSGDGSAFLTASFADAGGKQLLLQNGKLDGFIDYSVYNGSTLSTISVGYSGIDADGNAISSNLALLGDDAPLATFDGVRLPDFSRATVNFAVDGADGGSIAGTPTRLTITASSPPAVPEPATWAMMIAGFALVGGALRRRRGAAAIPA